MGARERFYKRGWHHTKTRGREAMVTCGFCGRRVPRYKTFTVFKGMRINDPLIRDEMRAMNMRQGDLFQTKIQACPGCARHRNIVQKKR